MITLGIETSCDETALALIETRGDLTSRPRQNPQTELRIIASLVHSQAELHSAYGGVFPTLAKREHGKNLIPLMEKLLKEARGHGARTSSASRPSRISDEDFLKLAEKFATANSGQNPELMDAFKSAEFLKDIPGIDRIAVTEGPGLEPTLWVGITFAKMLGELWGLPVIPVDHMEGHIVGSLLDPEAKQGEWQKLELDIYPALALLVSGGHTELVKVNAIGDYEILGKTKDDAAGEAFDKAARLLGLPYPGGPELSRLAREGRNENDISTHKLPRPMIGSGDLDFSFSGLKTAVLYALRTIFSEAGIDDPKDLPISIKRGLAREFEDAVCEVLDAKVRKALDGAASESKYLIVGGGVSANRLLRETLASTAKEHGIPLLLPSQHVSGDNALMIALAGSFHEPAKTPGDIRALGTKIIGQR